ncbi:MAG: glycosyltransferase, partial [Acidimicrobiales bacterium]
PGEEGDPGRCPTPLRRGPGASVVLATVGRPERLALVVDAVLADPGTLELLVVVDGPDPASIEVLGELAATRPRLRSLAVDRVGQLGALEAGVRHAAGEVVVLLDDDVVPAPGTITGHAAHHRHAEGLVVAGPMPVVVPDGKVTGIGTRLYAAEYDAHVAALLRGEHEVLDVLWTGNLSLRRSDCLRVGLRSPAFRAHYHADRDLGYRMAAAGMTGRFDPALAAAHRHDRTDAAFLRDAHRQGAGQMALHRVHGDRLGPFSVDCLVEDLPTPLRWVIVAVAATGHAGPAAARLLALGRTARALGASRVERAAAKMARRLMQCAGAIAGEEGVPPRPSPRSWRGERLAEAPDGG